MIRLSPWGFIGLCLGFGSMAVVLRKQPGKRGVHPVVGADRADSTCLLQHLKRIHG
jgi:hypothetical protein